MDLLMLTQVNEKPTAYRQVAARRKLVSQVLPIETPDPSRVAVVLNRNAKRVTDRLARRIERLVGSDHLFYSHSVDEAEEFAREIVHRGYGTVVCGGGDGTLFRTYNLLKQYIDESNAWRIQRYERFGDVQSLLSCPRFGFLRLGTGNALAPMVGARDPIEDVRRIIEYPPCHTVSVPLIDDGSARFMFAGMGYDSLILNDFKWLCSRARNPFLRPFTHGVLGYLSAMITRTLPRIVSGSVPQIQARVKNLGRAFYVDPRRGDTIEEIESGTTLFDGNAAMIGAGTTPYYGFNFRIFPFARMMPGMMHLRVACTGPFRTLANLGAIWRGSYRHAESLFDFLVEDVRITLAKPYPFQHSGDAQGEISETHLRVSGERLQLVDLQPQRRVWTQLD
jgi:diacylglycerol kinase family enzyme